jgi:hypothetical protein
MLFDELGSRSAGPYLCFGYALVLNSDVSDLIGSFILMSLASASQYFLGFSYFSDLELLLDYHIYTSLIPFCGVYDFIS